MSFAIEKLTKEKYKEWDDFCLLSDEAWFWHTSGWLVYTINYRPALETRDFSFFVRKDGKVKAIVTLTLESYKTESGEDFLEFSFGGGAIPNPALFNDLDGISNDRSERDVVYELIFAEIDRLALENKVKRLTLKQAPLSKKSLDKNSLPYNYLMRYGCLDISLNTRLIDLGKTEEELENDLRRNHKRNIKKESEFTTKIYTAGNITDEVFISYKEMHHKAAGRKTRPDSTFLLMHEWLKEEVAFLVVLELEGKPVGFEYYSVYKNNVYGFSAANDPDYERQYPIRHRLEWDAILYMKRRGYSFYEIGLQQFGPTLFDFPEKKELDITHFKKGFGGFILPFFMGEKYYDKEYFLSVYESRIKKFTTAFNQSKNGNEKN